MDRINVTPVSYTRYSKNEETLNNCERNTESHISRKQYNYKVHELFLHTTSTIHVKIYVQVILVP